MIPPAGAVHSKVLQYTIEGQTYYFAHPQADGDRDSCFYTKADHSSDADSDETESNCCVLQTHPGTPLQFAALAGSEAVVRLLLEAGADINDDGGIVYFGETLEILCADGTALELARRHGHTGVVKILSEAAKSSRRQSETSDDEKDESFLEGGGDILGPERKSMRVQ